MFTPIVLASVFLSSPPAPPDAAAASGDLAAYRAAAGRAAPLAGAGPPGRVCRPAAGAGFALRGHRLVRCPAARDDGQPPLFGPAQAGNAGR